MRELILDTMQVSLSADMPATVAELGLQPDPPLLRSIWQQANAVAEQYNDPGRFTAFIGYEWTSMPGGNNLHRNVLFRDGAELTDRTLPFSSLDSQDPEDLWRALDDYERNTGGRVLAIPHNANCSETWVPIPSGSA